MVVFFYIDSMKTIANQGMISMETHHTGDLIIQFDVEFPPMNFFNDLNILQVRKQILRLFEIYFETLFRN